MSRVLCLIFLNVLVLSSVSALRGQEAVESSDDPSSEMDIAAVTTTPTTESWKLARGAKEWGFQAGYAPMQPTFLSGRKEYDTTGRKFGHVGIQFGRVMGTVRGVTYEYLFEATPYAVAINNEVANIDAKRHRQNTHGIAVQPIGFRFIFRPHQRLKPFVQTAAGFIFTQKPIPVPESPNYNFVGDLGAGVMYNLTRQQVVKVGYRYYHISNMNVGEINPGYNANMFYFDLSVFRR